MSNNNHSCLAVKDKHYVLAWSLADEQKVKRYTDMLAALHGDPLSIDEYSKLADVMIDLVDKRHNDHHSAVAELGHDWLKVEPINQPSFEPDMVTFLGLNKLLRIYLALTSGVFKYMAHGNSAVTPTPYASTLGGFEDGSRQDCTTTGFQDIKGASLRLFSAYGSGVATTTIRTIGLFDATSSGIMLAMHNFASLGFVHTLNADAFSLGMVIDFVPFGDA